MEDPTATAMARSSFPLVATVTAVTCSAALIETSKVSIDFELRIGAEF